MARRMKDSGVEWIGEIPEDWEAIPLKYLVSYNDEALGENTDDDYEFEYIDIGSVEYGKGITNKEIMKFAGSPSRARRVVKENDIIVSTVRTYLKAVAKIKESDYPQIVSTGFVVFRAKDNKINPLYLNYAVLSHSFVSEVEARSVGISYPAINASAVVCIPIAVPSLSKQNQIASELEKKCMAIDSIIEKTRASIEEYKKLRQAVITQAVTKGVRGDRPMKDSGVEWIGRIPENWVVMRTRFIADSLCKGNGITKDDVIENGDISCVRYGEIYTKYDSAFEDTVSRTNIGLIASPKHICKGNILFTCTGELVEEIGRNVVYMGDSPCLVGGDIIVMEHKQHPEFLNYALNSSYSQVQKSCGKTKLKVVHISASEIGNVFIALPPIDEQKEIADYIRGRVLGIDGIIQKKSQYIEDLIVLKKSMIYEYVTGKKEVPA